MLKYFEYLGINNRVVMVKKYRYIKSRIHILCVCVVSVSRRCFQCWSFHGHIFWLFSPWCHFLKFHSFKVLFQTQFFDDFPLWLFCWKVPHQQEIYLIRTKTFDELLTHKWKYLSKKWSRRYVKHLCLTLGGRRCFAQYATEYSNKTAFWNAFLRVFKESKTNFDRL